MMLTRSDEEEEEWIVKEYLYLTIAGIIFCGSVGLAAHLCEIALSGFWAGSLWSALILAIIGAIVILSNVIVALEKENKPPRDTRMEG
jgi:hypothetical protein